MNSVLHHFLSLRGWDRAYNNRSAMKFGANTFIWAEAFGPEHFGVLPRLKDAGFDGIEIAMLSPSTLPATAIRRELGKYQFECTCCSAFGAGLSLASEDREVRKKAMTHVRDSLKAAAELGGSVVGGPRCSARG